ncbi:MAG: hypothetical protein ACYCVL_04745 [Gemmatimonadaceae bacterium]
MKRIGTIVATLAVAASTASAQGGLSAGHLGAAFGVSVPAGSLANAYSSGFNLAGIAEYQAPGQVMSVRGELFYERFPARAEMANGHASQTAAGIVNAVYHFQGSSFHPYLIGGMGLYKVTGNGAKPGFNGGVGIQIPLTGMTAYFEVRLHKVLTDGSSYVTVPVTFGLSF